MKILIAEDDKSISRGLEVFLKNKDNKILISNNGRQALKKTLREKPDLLISDIKMPEKNGLELLEELRAMNNTTPVIIITAYATVENAVKALKIGASDFLLKPLNLEELGFKIEKIQKEISLRRENIKLKEKLQNTLEPVIIGNSSPIKKVRQLIEKISYDPHITIMIYGESGTGKELVARSIHRSGNRKNNPFVAVNCAAIPDELMESEFFGYKKGAFTGANRDKIGLFKAANSGILFLDEVSEMSRSMQAKLLRVLQEKRIQPLGQTESEYLDIQIIGASNKNLKQLVKNGIFREDLYYRLSVMEIKIPPLRQRTEDIPLLIDFFLNQNTANPKLKFSKSALEKLQTYAWPGNIRELENIIKKMNVMCSKNIIELKNLPEEIQNSRVSKNIFLTGEILSEKYKLAKAKALHQFEINYFKYNLNKNNFNISQTARTIGISRATLHNKINRYSLNPNK